MDATTQIQIAVARADYIIVRYRFIVVRAAGLLLLTAVIRAVIWAILRR